MNEGRPDLAKHPLERMDSMTYGAKWANTELKRLARNGEYKAGHVIDALKDRFIPYNDYKVGKFFLVTRWLKAEGKYHRTHKTKYSKKYK